MGGRIFPVTEHKESVNSGLLHFTTPDLEFPIFCLLSLPLQGSLPLALLNTSGD